MSDPVVSDDLPELKISDQVFHYDRDELVAFIKRYYCLLLDMGHLPRDPASLQWPPEPAGWSDDELNVTALRLLGRSEAVIDLLRHLPYPLATEPGMPFDYKEATIDKYVWVKSYLRKQWSPEKYEDDPLWYDGTEGKLPVSALLWLPFGGPVLPGIITLTYHEAPGTGNMWVIDTERGM